MKLINTKFHGILDYLMGLFLIMAPWLFDFDYLNRVGNETWIPVILGIVLIIYSMFTNYELGVFKRLSMRTHLTLDILSGAFLAISPWLFNFSDYMFTFHLWLGIGEILIAFLTDTVPYAKRAPADANQRARQNV